MCWEEISVRIMAGDFRFTWERSRILAGAGGVVRCGAGTWAVRSGERNTGARHAFEAWSRNPRRFWTSTLGMAMMTFALGGIQVWMPTFFVTGAFGYTLESANFMFGIIIVVDGILAALAGGWLGDYLLPRMKGSYYFVSAASMALGVPFMVVMALFTARGPVMLPAQLPIRRRILASYSTLRR